MKKCIFCQIANNQLPSIKRYEDKDFYAFCDINPKAKVHILIVPKKHYGSISTLGANNFKMVGNLIKIAKLIAKQEGLNSFRIVFNNGKDAGMEIDHLHLHLLGGNKSTNLY